VPIHDEAARDNPDAEGVQRLWGHPHVVQIRPASRGALASAALRAGGAPSGGYNGAAVGVGAGGDEGDGGHASKRPALSGEAGR
jgi:hypothetical protein